MTVYSSPAELKLSYRSTFEHCFSHEALGNKAAVVDSLTHESIGRDELKHKSLLVAGALRSRLNKGDIVLLFSPNAMLYTLAVMASLAAGVQLACSAASQTPKELAYQITITCPKHFLVHPSLIAVFLEAARLCNIDMSSLKSSMTLLSQHQDIPAALAAKGWRSITDMLDQKYDFTVEKFDGAQAREPAVIFYSSGTTGRPKGVVLSHLNLNAEVDMLRIWGAYKADSTIISPLPLFHVAGAMLGFLGPLYIGCTAVIIMNFKFETFLASIVQCNVTVAAMTPPIMMIMSSHPDVTKTDLSRLKTIIVGAAPTSEHAMRKCFDRLQSIASPRFEILQTYGLSETAASSHYTLPGHQENFRTIGHVAAGMRARIVDEAGEDVQPGGPGELWLSGPSIMLGYLNAPDATRETMSTDGWLKTGDIAVADEKGLFYIVDRKKELIKYNGFQVAPAELESTLCDHPGIADAGVIGVLSRDGSTELPRAYIVPRDPKNLNDPQFAVGVQYWIKDRVSYTKHLRGGVITVPIIPRSGAGKILRRELRERAKIDRALGDVEKAKL